VTTSGDQREYRYDAFLSYRSASSGRSARRLNRHLLAISKRHREQRPPRIFYDQYALPPGRLQEALLDAVRASRHLVVLIDREVAATRWVALEIEQWLAAGGTPDRLFLVRTDRSVDLTWVRDTGGFAEPGRLPEPLRRLFTTEQAYIDYPARAVTRPDDKLARLCATLVGADPRDYLVAEAEIQRRRNRRTTVVAGALAALLVAAVFFGVQSEVNRRAADRSAIEAFAQADAAEALLAAADAPTRSIERAVRAGAASSSPTVRSAMLAVSQQARRLRRALAYPEDRAGNPLAAAAFSADGSRLVAWGDGPRPETSYLQIWNVRSGDAEFSGVVDAPDIGEVVRVSRQVATGCSSRGPVVLNLADGAARSTPLGPPAGRCAAHVIQGGVVVLAGETATFVDRRGRPVRVDGVSSVAAHPAARFALAAGRSGTHVLRGGRWITVANTPAQARTADPNGAFLARVSRTSWQFIDQDDDGPRLRPVTVPAAAADVVALVDFARLSGDVMWVTDDGTVGWSGDDTTTRVGNPQGEPSWSPFRTRLAALHDGDAVVIFRNTATVVRSPRVGMPVGAPLDGWQPGRSPGWAQRVVEHRLGVSTPDRMEPVLGRCLDGQAVFVTTDLPEGGSLAIKGDGEATETTGPAIDGGNCTLVDAGAHLDVVTSAPEARIRLRDNVVPGSVVPAPDGTAVALVQPGVPVQILSTEPEDSLPRPWNVSTNGGARPAALGDRQVGEDLDGLVLVDGGRTARVPVPDLASVIAVRPDGRGAVVTTADGARLAVVEGDQVRAGAAVCAGAPVRYEPEPSFRRSVAAAQAQIPVIRSKDGATVTDCRTGRTIAGQPAIDVLQYDVGRTAAVLVTRAGTDTTITRWRPDRGTALSVTDGPPLPDPDARLVVGDRTDDALTFGPGGRRLSLQRRTDGRWATALEIVPNLADVPAAALVDGGTLLLAVSSSGGFELYDTATGRLLVSDPIAVDVRGGDRIADMVAFRHGEDLFVYLFGADRHRATAVVQVPIGIPALTTQLCGLYRAAGCPTTG
jgi:hypothetical protein